MKTDFKSSFSRDVKKIIDSDVLNSIEKTIKNVEEANNIKEIDGFKKLTGYKTFYRIKLKDYRIGLHIENKTVYFVRCLHRKDIYKIFP